MQDKKKQKAPPDKNKDEPVVHPGETTPSSTDNTIGTVNRGNPSTVVQQRSNRELHTKNTIMGSDSDGQAD